MASKKYLLSRVVCLLALGFLTGCSTLAISPAGRECQNFNYDTAEIYAGNMSAEEVSNSRIAAARSRVQSCTQSLAEAMPQYRGRIIRHTVYRALHNLYVGDYKAAMVDADTVEKLATTNEYMLPVPALREAYDGSLSYTLEVMRSMAQSGSGDFAAADQTFLRLIERAPYSNFLYVVSRWHLSPELRNTDVFFMLLDEAVRLDSSGLLIRHVTAGRLPEKNSQTLEDALAILLDPYLQARRLNSNRWRYRKSSDVTPDFSADLDVVEYLQAKDTTVDVISLADVAVQYGLIGDTERADEFFDLAMQRNETDDRPRKAQRREALALVEVFLKSVAAFNRGDYELAKQSLIGSQFSVTPQLAQYLQRLGEQTQDRAVSSLGEKVDDAWSSRMEEIASAARKDGLRNVRLFLPEVVDGTASKYASPIPIFRSDGFTSKMQKDGSRLVKFSGRSTVVVALEEMTMLRAAEIALNEGHTHFLVLENDLLKRTQTTTYTYGGISTADLGYVSQLRVFYVNDAKLPPQYSHQSGRLFEAQQVYDDLYRKYASDE